ncbi:MAG: TonB-dependent receptor [Rhodothermales bacterium]|nr:TonB-dependent receptor [Rhodothermales bacterium]
MFRLFCVLLLLASARVLPAFGQSIPPDSVYVLPAITVEDLRSPLSANDAAAYVTRLSASMLDESGVRTVGEALERHGAVFVRRYGTNGSSGVTLRGTGPGQTAVLLDGLPLESPQLGQVDLSLLPVAFLSGVDVMHGGASSFVGSSAIGGVISLRSLAVQDRNSVRISTGLGAWGERTGSGRMTFSSGRLRGLVAGEARRSDGDFPYVDRASLLPTRRARENSDGTATNVLTRLTWIGRRSTFEVSGWAMSGERGLPGLSGSSSTTERQEDRIRRVWMTYRRGVTAVRASIQRSLLRYTSPELEIDDTGRTVSSSLRLTRSQSLSRYAQSEFGVDVSAQSATHPSLQGAVRQHRVRAFVSAAVRAGSVTVLPTVLGDWTSGAARSEAHASPGVRVRYEGLGQGRLAIKAGLSSSFRIPTFNDLFWKGLGAAGNSELEAEKGRTADAGFALINQRTTLDVTVFYQTVQNQITWIPDESGIWTPRNLDRVRNIGVESKVAHSVVVAGPVSLDASLRHTFTGSRDRSPDVSTASGHQLRYVPRNVMNADVTLAWNSLRFGVAGRHVGRRYLTTDGSEWLAPYTVLGGDLSGRFLTGFGWLDVGIHVENIGGVEYQVMSGYPMPPRSARLQLTLTIQ